MKFALLGHTGHLTYYEQVLHDLPDVQVAAVALASPSETLDAFAKAPGVTDATPRYTDAEQMLEQVQPDLVQICVQPHLIPRWIERCAQRGIAVMAEKPLAMDLETLAHLYDVVKAAQIPLAPLHGYRRMKHFEAVAQAVRAGQIGEPLGSYSQISYRWGARRPDYFRSRESFPGIAPFIGAHVVDWLLWAMGDVLTAVSGWETTAAHPDYPACASQAGLLFQMRNGGVATVALDFLRPATAPTHGDERVRIVGSRGVAESFANDGTATLINEAQGVTTLAIPTTPHWYTAFVQSIRGEGESFISVDHAFRVTEIAIKAQQAIDEGRTIAL